MAWMKPADPLPFRGSVGIPGISGKSPSSQKNRNGARSFIFTLADRPRLKRASKAKVRSGCTTCKKRHVKCDEAKPSCQRCLKWQGFCGGYAPPSATASPTSSDEDSTPACRKPGDAQWEKSYFGHWASLSGTLGGGLFPSTLFEEKVPQLSQIEPAVRYAVMAIGALASSKAPDVLIPDAKETRSAAQHYQKALDFYGRALGLVRLQQDVCSDYTLRVAVISCVLFACFEALHDSCDASISHIRHGLMMVDQIMSAQTNTAEDDTKPEIIVTSGHAIKQELPNDESPIAFVLDDEILQVFQRMEYLAFGVSLLQGLPPPSRIFLCLSETFDLSRPFTDLTQARQCLDQFQHACMRSTIAKPTSISSPLAPLEDWYQAFSPLACQLTRNSTNSLAYYQAISLLLQYHIAHTSLALIAYATNSPPISMPPMHILNGLTPHYKEMLRLAQTLMTCEPRANPRRRVFTMDHEPALAVIMTAMSCVDEGVRDDALAMLDQYPQRDGFWDRQRIMRCHGPNRITNTV